MNIDPKMPLEFIENTLYNNNNENNYISSTDRFIGNNQVIDKVVASKISLKLVMGNTSKTDESSSIFGESEIEDQSLSS